VSSTSGLYDELQRANRRATRLLLAGVVVIAAVMVWVAAGWIIGPDVALDPVMGVAITAVGTAVGLLFTYLAYRSGPSLALRAARAREVTRTEAPELHNLLDEVCVSAGISGTKPKLYLVDDPAPNAFATGLKLEDSHVAVTTGLVERLPRYELRAVIAHEVAHIVNDDIRAVTVAVATAGLVALLADVLVRFLWFGGGRAGRRGGGGGRDQGAAQLVFMVLGILALILAPIAAQLIRFAVSRQREYLADATAAELLRDPQSMVNALRRLELDTTEIERFEVATAHLWFEEPNETKGNDGAAKMARRFATHPSIQERIERLATLNAGTVRVDAPLPPPAHRASSSPPSPPPDVPPPPGARPGSSGSSPLPGFPPFPGSPPDGGNLPGWPPRSSG
jgi:heat shock protein HtpX